MKTRGRIALAAALLLALGAAACDGGSTEPSARPGKPSMTCGPGLTAGGGRADSLKFCTQNTGAP